MSKVININEHRILFDCQTMLYSEHEQDCCEKHYLSFEYLELSEFEGLNFNLEDDKFFERVKDYGIRLIPVKGHKISIPAYGYNNGYYSHELDLVVENKENKCIKGYSITECQDIEG